MWRFLYIRLGRSISAFSPVWRCSRMHLLFSLVLCSSQKCNQALVKYRWFSTFLISDGRFMPVTNSYYRFCLQIHYLARSRFLSSDVSATPTANRGMNLHSQLLFFQTNIGTRISNSEEFCDLKCGTVMRWHLLSQVSLWNINPNQAQVLFLWKRNI